MTLIADQLDFVAKRAHEMSSATPSADPAASETARRQRELNSLVDILLATGQAMRRSVDRFWKEATAELDVADADAAVMAELEWASQVAGLLVEVERAEVDGLVVERADELRAAQEGATVMGTNILTMNKNAEAARAAGDYISLEDLMAELGVEPEEP